jgi:deoxyribonuclease V
MQVHHRHRWDVTPKEAVEIQRSLASEIVEDTPLDIPSLTTIAGVDVSVQGECLDGGGGGVVFS